MEWRSDADLFSLVETELFSAVVGDSLDRQGYRHQFLPSRIRGLRDYGVVVGRAMPVLEADVFDDREPFGRMFEALDGLEPGEIYLAAGGSPRYALFGGLMSVAARARGARGAVLCGFHRDTREVLQNGFPVFSYGAYAQDQQVRGRVIDYAVPIEIDGVVVKPRDLVIADLDGVVVVPTEAEDAVMQAALEKVRTESTVRKALEAGMLAKDAFDRFGVL